MGTARGVEAWPALRSSGRHAGPTSWMLASPSQRDRPRSNREVVARQPQDEFGAAQDKKHRKVNDFNGDWRGRDYWPVAGLSSYLLCIDHINGTAEPVSCPLSLRMRARHERYLRTEAIYARCAVGQFFGRRRGSVISRSLRHPASLPSSRNCSHPPLLRTCVYRKLKLGRSGDEVRPGWRVNRSHRFAEPGEKPAHPCSKIHVF